MSVVTSPIVNGDPGLTASQISSITAMLSGEVSATTPLLVAKTNQTYSRTSVNAAGDSSFTTLYSFVIPGGSMGPNGSLHWEAEISFTDPATNATTNEFQLRIGTTGICPAYATGTGGTTFDNRSLSWHNTSTTAQKYRGSFVKQSSSAAGFTTTSIDTTIDQTVNFDCRWSAATPSETHSLLSFRAWVEFGA